MTMRAEAKLDSNGRLLELRVYRKGRKALLLNFLYGSDGLLENIQFKGDTQDMPSIAEIMALINGNLWKETAEVVYRDTIINRNIDKVGETVLLSAVGLSSCGIQISGTWVGALEFEGTVDGINWVQARAVQFGGTLVGGTIVNGLFFAQVGGLLRFRIRASAWTNGTATIYLEATAASNAVTLANSLPTGVNSIGQVTANAGTNLNTSLLATEATLGTVHGHVDSIDGKITACNTGAITGTLTQSTKHDAATYKTAIFNAAADGDIVPLVANKKIKVHYLDIQAQGTVTVTIRNDDVAGTILDVWKLEDREGAVKAFLPYPASHYHTLQVAGDALYCDLSAAVTVKICVVYTDADAA